MDENILREKYDCRRGRTATLPLGGGRILGYDSWVLRLAGVGQRHFTLADVVNPDFFGIVCTLMLGW